MQILFLVAGLFTVTLVAVMSGASFSWFRAACLNIYNLHGVLSYGYGNVAFYKRNDIGFVSITTADLPS